MRAHTLAQLHRFDEALAACAPEAFSPVPPQLPFRAAWVEAQRSNLGLAIEKIRATLADYPDFYAGWQCLSDWCQRNNDLDGAVKAAEKMALLAPHEPVPLGYLAELQIRSGDRTPARQALKRAFTLSPTYDYAGHKLFELQLEAGDRAEAEQTLSILERQGVNPRTLTRRVQWLAGNSMMPKRVSR